MASAPDLEPFEQYLRQKLVPGIGPSALCKLLREERHATCHKSVMRRLGDYCWNLAEIARIERNRPKGAHKSVRARQFREIGVLDRWKQTLED